MTDSPQPRRLLHAALSSAGIRLIDLPSRYGFHLLVAAELGALRAGQFYIVFSVMIALSGLGRLGIDRALIKQISTEMTLGRHGAVRHAVRRAYLYTLIWSGAVTAVMLAGAHPLADWVLHKPALATPLMLAALSVIPQNLGIVAAGALAGLNRIGISQMIYSWLWPATWCIVTLLVGTSVDGGILLIAGSFGFVALVGGAMLWRRLRVLDRTDRSPSPPLVRLGLALFTTELTQLLISSAPVLILGAVASSQAVGVFALAARIALIVNVVVSGIAGMASPRYAELYVRGDRPALASAAAQAVGLATILSIMPVCVMLLIPGTLLGLFGHGYSAGRLILCTLALGQLSAALFATMPEMLGMTAHANTLRRINIAVLAILLAGCGVLVPALGGEGAALATALATIVNGAAASWAVYRLLGIAPLAMLVRLVEQRLVRRRITSIP